MGLFWSKLVDLAENMLNTAEGKCSFIFGFGKNGSQPSEKIRCWIKKAQKRLFFVRNR